MLYVLHTLSLLLSLLLFNSTQYKMHTVAQKAKRTCVQIWTYELSYAKQQ